MGQGQCSSNSQQRFLENNHNVLPKEHLSSETHDMAKINPLAQPFTIASENQHLLPSLMVLFVYSPTNTRLELILRYHRNLCITGQEPSGTVCIPIRIRRSVEDGTCYSFDSRKGNTSQDQPLASRKNGCLGEEGTDAPNTNTFGSKQRFDRAHHTQHCVLRGAVELGCGNSVERN